MSILSSRKAFLCLQLQIPSALPLLKLCWDLGVASHALHRKTFQWCCKTRRFGRTMFCLGWKVWDLRSLMPLKGEEVLAWDKRILWITTFFLMNIQSAVEYPLPGLRASKCYRIRQGISSLFKIFHDSFTLKRFLGWERNTCWTGSELDGLSDTGLHQVLIDRCKETYNGQLWRKCHLGDFPPKPVRLAYALKSKF